MLKEMFKKPVYITLNKTKETAEPQVPEGLWIKCPKCREMLYKEDVAANRYVCYKCGGYFRVKAKNRIRMVVDRHTFEEWDTDLYGGNPLEFEGYEEKLEQTREKTKLNEAVITGQGKIYGEDTVLGICDSRFMMGSMGHMVGEKLTRAIERATKKQLPLIIFTCSGGARMQEGMISLMQMAKTAAALKRHSDAGLFYLSVLTDPTTGGVTASFAMLGDVILGEPGALVGFAGPRVIEQTIGQKLPEGFQRSEFLVEHGIIDGIVERKDLKDTLHRLIQMHKPVQNLNSLALQKHEATQRQDAVQMNQDNRNLNAWDRVRTARMPERATAMDYIQTLFEDFMELHGDRAFRDDGAIVGGLAWMDEIPVTVIGQQKGRNTKENVSRNFGMPNPEGYRKALRLMKQAEKFGRPVITFVDTPGAFCGLEAEERGQGEAIARNLLEMSALKVPVLCIVIGEGGSGGALALAVGNEVWMMENAVYSVLSPEGFASILWKDSKRCDEAAEVMKITAPDLLRLKVIDKIIPEPEPAMPHNLEAVCNPMKTEIRNFLKCYLGQAKEEIARQRYERFMKY
ncbi:acetyl-CoA carboxylase carboxyltransferase subunit alpha [Lachnospiraceae bacterium ASD3451]|uniref:acetyl-CoA carboxylase carboxyltransferase subunit alpha n=1 Tax=Diplocloster agilis TaxID=2850323 RepID=UPI001E119111|nr:acetyl-CoA carboxylase carboxyltransferase subunit alpha [Diplocloster agilis]MBU9746482.1 acetyl-CoA carboxylase carboxyltransferase subunit alpha [Diplocloster agilis]